MTLRAADSGDIPALLHIYAQYIQTPVTFECVLPAEREFAARAAGISAVYPYLVWEEQGQIAGYAYAHRQMEREAYQWNAELSIYMDPAYTSRGIGKKLYAALMEILALQGVKTVYGGVTLPNERSERLHLGLGFRLLGTYHNTGYKCGAWHDVSWFEKQIAPYEADPAPITPMAQLPPGQVLEILGR